MNTQENGDKGFSVEGKWILGGQVGKGNIYYSMHSDLLCCFYI